MSIWILLLLTGFITFGIDQLTKFIILKRKIPFYLNKFGTMEIGWKYPTLLPGVRALQMISLLGLGIILVFLQDVANTIVFVASGLIFGGSVSNLIDRKIRGGIVDFIPLPFRTFRGEIAKGNMADLFVVVGILLLVFTFVNIEI